VADACLSAGLAPLDVMASPLQGPAGNVEFLLHAREGGGSGRPDVEAAIAEAGAAVAG
jgi:hypothetical protein